MVSSCHAIRGVKLVRSAARLAMQRDERLPLLVSSVVCVRPWLGRVARLENRFVDCVARIHGGNVSGQCIALRPSSLPLHGPVFHPWCYCFPRIRCWAFAAWAVRMELGLRCNSCWRRGPHLHSRTHARSLSAKWFMVQPRLVGYGPTLFAGLSKPVDLKLVSRLEFGSGAVAMRYEPRR
jgi:hypothetical protein